MISQYGVLFEKQLEAENIIIKVQQSLNDFQRFIEEKPNRKVAYFIWKNPWMVVGKNTFINYLLKLNKFENVYEDLDRYPEIDVSQINSVDRIFLSSEPYPFKKEHIKELQTYCANATIELVDGEMFSWYGSRLIKAFSYFKKLHQDL